MHNHEKVDQQHEKVTIRPVVESHCFSPSVLFSVTG